MGVLAVYNGSRKIGNISCLFDEFVTSKYVYIEARVTVLYIFSICGYDRCKKQYVYILAYDK